MQVKKAVICLIFLASSVKLCRVSSDFEFPTFEEGFERSGAVVLGTVDQVIEGQPFRMADIVLKETQFYKGCGPSTIRIGGYSSGAHCGVFPPVEGSRVIVLLCNMNGKWMLNNFAAFTGQYSGKNPKFVKKLKSVSQETKECGLEIEFEECDPR